MALIEEYRMESSIIFAVFFAFSLPIITMRQITLEPNNQETENSIVYALIFMTLIGYLIQIAVAVRMTILTRYSKIRISQLSTALIIVWLYCATTSAQVIQYVQRVARFGAKNSYYDFNVTEGIILTVREAVMYLTTFWVLIHFREINQKTIRLKL